MCPCACRRADFGSIENSAKKKNRKTPPPSVTLADDMPDDDDKPAPIPFTVDVTVEERVNGDDSTEARLD
jgi:hypothetical protein